MEFPHRIYLIGFMGSGKSHSGKLLSSQLQYGFLDLDTQIEAHAGMQISDFFATYGEEAFRKLEASTLRETATLQRHVIACGGGTPCFYDNIDWINVHGLSIYLRASTPLLASRLLPECNGRPLLQSISAAELPAFIDTRLRVRAPFYAKAHLTFDQSDQKANSDQALLAFLRAQSADVYRKYPHLQPA